MASERFNSRSTTNNSSCLPSQDYTLSAISRDNSTRDLRYELFYALRVFQPTGLKTLNSSTQAHFPILAGMASATVFLRRSDIRTSKPLPADSRYIERASKIVWRHCRSGAEIVCFLHRCVRVAVSRGLVTLQCPKLLLSLRGVRTSHPQRRFTRKTGRRLLMTISTGTKTMKALRFAEFGPPSVLRFEEIAIPEPCAGQEIWGSHSDVILAMAGEGGTGDEDVR